jgi:hypothetical protein
MKMKNFKLYKWLDVQYVFGHFLLKKKLSVGNKTSQQGSVNSVHRGNADLLQHREHEDLSENTHNLESRNENEKKAEDFCNFLIS